MNIQITSHKFDNKKDLGTILNNQQQQQQQQRRPNDIQSVGTWGTPGMGKRCFSNSQLWSYAETNSCA